MDCRCGCPKDIHRDGAGRCYGIVGGAPCPCAGYHPDPQLFCDLELHQFDILCWDLCCLWYWPEGVPSHDGDIPGIVDWFLTTPTMSVQ